MIRRRSIIVVASAFATIGIVLAAIGIAQTDPAIGSPGSPLVAVGAILVLASLLNVIVVLVHLTIEAFGAGARDHGSAAKPVDGN